MFERRKSPFNFRSPFTDVLKSHKISVADVCKGRMIVRLNDFAEASDVGGNKQTLDKEGLAKQLPQQAHNIQLPQHHRACPRSGTT